MSPFENPPQASVCAESYRRLNSKGHLRRLRDTEGLSCVDGRVFNNYLGINDSRFGNECVQNTDERGRGEAWRLHINFLFLHSL